MTNRTKSEFTSRCRIAAKTNFLMLLLFPARSAHARYSSRMIDRFLNWGDHGKPKSGKIKGRCQPPLVQPYLHGCVFQKYQNCVSTYGECNLSFLQITREQINFKLNEKSRMITVKKYSRTSSNDLFSPILSNLQLKMGSSWQCFRFSKVSFFFPIIQWYFRPRQYFNINFRTPPFFPLPASSR